MKPLDLIKHAIKAQDNSESKYSNYPVGCALLSDDDKIIYGCNIESAVYPSTLCAERIAIYSALSQGFKKFKAIAIVSNTRARPCGSCRQIMYEYLGDIFFISSIGQNNLFVLMVLYLSIILIQQQH